MENLIIELIIGSSVVIFFVGLYLHDKSSQKGKTPFSDRLHKY